MISKISHLTTFGAVLALAVCTFQTAECAGISNGLLVVNVRDDNGAINNVSFNGTEFFRKSIPVSDFAFQNDTDTSTFSLFNAEGSEPFLTNVSVNLSTITITTSGVYAGGGANVGFERTYSLIPGRNVLRISTEFSNLAMSPVTLSYLDTYDPDQGVDFGAMPSTTNDVFTLSTLGGTAKVGRATSFNGKTVVLGSVDPSATVAAGSPFQINSGAGLNEFFSAPFDANGVSADQGLHAGIRTTIGAGEKRQFVTDMAFGSSFTVAQQAFVDSQSAPVPEPTAALFGAALVGFLGVARRRSGSRGSV